MKSFGLNDGRPAGEIVVNVDDNGAVTSAKNVITNTEYVDNPNSVQVITGTLANPFGDVDIEALGAALISGDAHTKLFIDASQVMGSQMTTNLVRYFEDEGIYSSSANVAPENVVSAYYLKYSNSGLDIGRIYMSNTVSDMSSVASQILTTLTIYWHPMP